VAAVVIGADQASKAAVRSSITPGEERRFLPGVQLVNTRNHGVAFGFLPGSHVGVTILIAVALLVLLVYFARHLDRPWIWLPTGMLVGGALGNVIDRVRAGAVTDFVKLPLGWPPFNLADASITVGILALFVVIDRGRARERHAPMSGARSEDAPASRFTVAYRDEHLLVIDKGPGLVVHPGRGHRDDTLSQLLAAELAGGDPQRAGIVHRLDRDTSGLMVVARSEEAHRRLQAELAARRIEREYLALVEGRPPSRTGTVDAPVGRDPRLRTRMAVGGAGAREARTHFTLERSLPRSSLLRLRLETGRTHQIRVHMSAIGHPVAGDPEYGTPGLYGLERQFLHATRLAFAHPLSGERLEVGSPMPADLRAALERAERIS